MSIAWRSQNCGEFEVYIQLYLATKSMRYSVCVTEEPDSARNPSGARYSSQILQITTCSQLSSISILGMLLAGNLLHDVRPVSYYTPTEPLMLHLSTCINMQLCKRLGLSHCGRRQQTHAVNYPQDEFSVSLPAGLIRYQSF